MSDQLQLSRDLYWRMRRLCFCLECRRGVWADVTELLIEGAIILVGAVILIEVGR